MSAGETAGSVGLGLMTAWEAVSATIEFDAADCCSMREMRSTKGPIASLIAAATSSSGVAGVGSDTDRGTRDELGVFRLGLVEWPVMDTDTGADERAYGEEDCREDFRAAIVK